MKLTIEQVKKLAMNTTLVLHSYDWCDIVKIVLENVRPAIDGPTLDAASAEILGVKRITISDEVPVGRFYVTTDIKESHTRDEIKEIINAHLSKM